MSAIVSLILGSLVMEAASLRTAPKPVITREQFFDAARSLEGLKNNTVFLCSVKSSVQKSSLKGSAKKSSNPHIIGDGTPLPLEKLNWEVEDFNPEALMDSPCGMETEGPERVGGGKMAVPQAQLIKALKLWSVELTKDVNGDFAVACKKLDVKPADGVIDEDEYDAWIDAQAFDARVKTPEGDIMDAMWMIMGKPGEPEWTLDQCKKDLDKFVGPKGIFNAAPAR
jgi:hypothetical protein